MVYLKSEGDGSPVNRIVVRFIAPVEVIIDKVDKILGFLSRPPKLGSIVRWRDSKA